MNRTPYLLMKVYKDDNAFYPGGSKRQIDCNHVLEGSVISQAGLVTGVFSIDAVGSIVPLPTTTIPIAVGGGLDNQMQTALIPPGTVATTPHSSAITSTRDQIFCFKVKDLKTLVTSYVDIDSYLEQIILCNAAAYVSACGVPTNGDSSDVAKNTATVFWDADSAAAGFEYINNTSSPQPNVDGTFTTANSIDLTGLTADTQYYFHVRKICGVGDNGISAWIRIDYHTTA